jgi:hypothetical protein
VAGGISQQPSGWTAELAQAVSTRVAAFDAGVPVGIHLGPTAQLVLTPRVAYHRYTIDFFGSPTLSTVAFAGASAGLALKIVAGVTVMPEITIMDPVSVPRPAVDKVRYDGVLFQGAVGLLFTP